MSTNFGTMLQIGLRFTQALTKQKNAIMNKTGLTGQYFRYGMYYNVNVLDENT